MNRRVVTLTALLLVGTALLVPAQAAAQAPSLLRGPIFVTAIGDSYTSGEGAGPYTTATDINGQNTCRRSETKGYPSLVARDLDRLQQTVIFDDVSLADEPLPDVEIDLESIACAGATTEDIAGGWNVFEGNDARPRQHDEPYPQIDASRLERSDLVIGTIGGNDVVFTQILKDCAFKDAKTIFVPLDEPTDCLSTPAELNEADQLLDRLDRRLHDTYRILHERLGDHAAVYMGSYPQLFSGDRDSQMCATFNMPKATAVNGVVFPVTRGQFEHSDVPFSPSEQDRIGELQSRMNAIMRRAAADEGVHFVDMLSSFEGHAACDPESWLNVIGLPQLKDDVDLGKLLDPRSALDEVTEDVRFPPSGSFHPNADGYEAMAATMIDTIATTFFTAPRFETGLAQNPPSVREQVFGATPDAPGASCSKSGSDYPAMPDLFAVDCVRNVELDIDGDDRPDRVLLWGSGEGRGARAYLATGEVLPLTRPFDTWDEYGDGPAEAAAVTDLDDNGADELMVTHIRGANTDWIAPMTVRFADLGRKFLDVVTYGSGAVASIPVGGGAGYGSAYGCVRAGDQPLLVQAGISKDPLDEGFTWSVDHFRKVGMQLLAVGHRGGWSPGDRTGFYASVHADGCDGDRPDVGRVVTPPRSPEETVQGVLRAAVAQDEEAAAPYLAGPRGQVGGAGLVEGLALISPATADTRPTCDVPTDDGYGGQRTTCNVQDPLGYLTLQLVRVAEDQGGWWLVDIVY